MDELFPDGVNLDVASFSRLAEAATTDSPIQSEANQILTEYKSLENSWLNLDIIMEQSSSIHAKFIAMHIFIDGVQKQWETISEEQQAHYREFFFSATINFCNESVERSLISEANRCLVEILKIDWPASWPSFIHDYIAASKASIASCINCLVVLSELSDDAIDNVSLTSERTTELQNALTHDVGLVIDHAESVLQSGSFEAASQALQTLSHFLRWMDLSDVFSSAIVPSAISLIADENLRNSALDCLAAIAEHPSSTSSVEMSELFDSFVAAVEENGGIEACGSTSLAEALSAFLTLDGCSLLQGQILGAPTLSIQWILKILDSQTAVRTCVDCLAELSTYFFSQKSIVQPIPELIITMFTVLINNMESPTDFPPRELTNSETYENMRVSVIVLANLQREATAQILVQEMQEAEDIESLLKIIWSASAVSGAYTQEIETQIAAAMLTFLEGELDSGASYEVACGYAYLAAHFTRYLYNNWEHLHNVSRRLFSYLTEENEELQDASVSAILMLAQRCWKHLIVPHQGEKAFVIELTEQINSLISALPGNLVPTLYEALSELIIHVNDESKGHLIAQMLVAPVELWKTAIEDLTEYTNILTPIAVFSKVIVISDTAFYPEVEEVIERAVQLLTQLSSTDEEGAVDVRSNILELVEAFFKFHYDSSSVQPLIQIVVTDYMEAPINLKLPQSLDCFSQILRKLPSEPPFDESFLSDIVLATKEVLDLPSPEIAASYAKLLGILLGFEFVRSSELFGQLLELLIVGVMRPEEFVTRRALSGLLNFLNDTATNESLREFVVANFAIPILQDLTTAIMDRIHLPVFNMLSQAIILLIRINPDKESVCGAMVERITTNYHHVPGEDATNFVQTLISSTENEKDFKEIMKDFIISLRKTSSKARAMYSQIDNDALGLDGPAEISNDPFTPEEF